MNYCFNPNIVLRSPLKPLKTTFTQEELKSFFKQKEVQEALFLSSPNLLNEYEKWCRGEIKDKKEEKKLVHSLLKYALRMHSRCTPFGLHAGCNLIQIGEENNITIFPEKAQRSTRLDMLYTCALAQALEKLPFIQPHLKFYPNSSLYLMQDKMRYVEYYYKETRRIHQISAVDYSVYLQKILNTAQNGATIKELAESIVENDIRLEEAQAFVNEIVGAQLLVSELEPAVTGTGFLSQITTTLLAIQKEQPSKELAQILSLLTATKENLHTIDQKIGNPVAVYKDLAESLKPLGVTFEINRLFQVDMFTETAPTSTLSKNFQPALEKSMKILKRLISAPDKTNLSRFQEEFYKRYEDKEVPLLTALDTETGIGYAGNNNNTGDVRPLVDDIALPLGKTGQSKINWDEKQDFLLKKLVKAKKQNGYVVTINEKEVEKLKEISKPMPDSFSLMFEHIGKRGGKDLFSIENIGGSSATYLLGRFGAGNEKIEKLLFEIAEKESQNNPDKILAEIVHLPESRTGNILLRPAFRKYEIPYLSKSALPKTQQITLDDLYISIRNNRIFLRSQKHNKAVLPYLGNAHNFSFNALPIYHFLCDLQTQDKSPGIYFSWGNLSESFSFLPRVEIENVIVSSAKWQLKKEQYQSLLDKKKNPAVEIKKWREKWLLPDLIYLADGDNKLLINLKDELSVGLFLTTIKKRETIILEEFLFDPKTAIVKDKAGNAYTNEFIAILEKEVEQAKQEKQVIIFENPAITRNFSLGSEWLYYKIYCGVKTADSVLTDLIKPLTEQLIQNNLIDYWFFIRYADPDLHLRIRFHFNDTNNIGKVVRLFQKAMEKYENSGAVWKVQTDTYQREIERYGANTMTLSEQLFFYDSQCITKMLSMIAGAEGEEIRWLFGVKAIDALLSDFQYPDEQKLILFEGLKSSFANEFNMNKDLKMQLDKKFRDKREKIENILIRTDKTRELAPLLALLNQKSKNTQPIISAIIAMKENGELMIPINDLLLSYIHMLMNRLFKNQQRLHEMVIYDFMWRTYRSLLAREKQKQLTQ